MFDHSFSSPPRCPLRSYSLLIYCNCGFSQFIELTISRRRYGNVQWRSEVFSLGSKCRYLVDLSGRAGEISFGCTTVIHKHQESEPSSGRVILWIWFHSERGFWIRCGVSIVLCRLGDLVISQSLCWTFEEKRIGQGTSGGWDFQFLKKQFIV